MALSMTAKTSLALFIPRASSASWKIALSSASLRSGALGAAVCWSSTPRRWA
jgi:hypothetical protein